MPARIDERAMAAAIASLESQAAPNVTTTAREFKVNRRTLSDRWQKFASEPAYNDDGLDGEIDPEAASEIPVFVRTYDTAEHFVYPLGDVHKGARHHQQQKWRDWLGYLGRTQNVSMLGTGDFCNCAIKDSKSESYDEEMTVSDAKWEIAEELTPLAEADKLDCLIRGNHEDRIYRAVGEDPIYDVARHLKVNYSPTVAVVIYQIGDIEYTAYVLHGKGGGAVGARANRLKKHALTIQADIYVSGHTHSQLVFPDEFYSVDREALKVVRNKQMFVSSGSFLAMEDYAATSGFSPTHIGAPRIRLDGRRKDVHVSV